MNNSHSFRFHFLLRESERGEEEIHGREEREREREREREGERGGGGGGGGGVKVAFK